MTKSDQQQDRVTQLKSNWQLAALTLLVAVVTIAILKLSGFEGPDDGELRPKPGTPGQIEQTINFIVNGWPWSVAVPLMIVVVCMSAAYIYGRFYRKD